MDKAEKIKKAHQKLDEIFASGKPCAFELAENTMGLLYHDAVEDPDVKLPENIHKLQELPYDFNKLSEHLCVAEALIRTVCMSMDHVCGMSNMKYLRFDLEILRAHLSYYQYQAVWQ